MIWTPKVGGINNIFRKKTQTRSKIEDGVCWYGCSILVVYMDVLMYFAAIYGCFDGTDGETCGWV